MLRVEVVAKKRSLVISMSSWTRLVRVNMKRVGAPFLRAWSYSRSVRSVDAKVFAFGFWAFLALAVSFVEVSKHICCKMLMLPNVQPENEICWSLRTTDCVKCLRIRV